MLISSLVIVLSITISYFIIVSKLKYELPTISIIKLYDNQNNEYLTLANGNKQSYVTLDNISGYAIDAFISLEDKKFHNHEGIDFLRIISAIITDISDKNFSQGASTITQQYVKNIFLTNEKSIKRKLYEIFIALNIEAYYSKEQILEGYLNSIYFDHGIYGIEDAAKYYFGKSASELSLLEAASLASIPKSPVYYSPIKNPTNNLERRNLALKQMYEDSFITEKEYLNALNKDLKLVGINIKNEYNSAPWYQDLVINQLKTIPVVDKFSHFGLKIYTSLDLELTKYINEAMLKRIPESGIETSIVVMEPKTGKIISIIGGNDYNKNTFNKAVNSYRQPGSTVKPFLYLSALENGFTVSNTFKSEKTTFYLNNQNYSPSNFKDIYANMDISMVYALATSDNIYAMKTHLFLGEQVLADKLKKFGITTEINPYASLALGTAEVSLIDMTNCYSTLANLGIKHTPSTIEKIETMNGEVIYKNSYLETKVAEKNDCYILSETMTSVFDNNLTINIRPTCASIASLMKGKFAAKSGSTDTDNWIFGFNSEICVGVWTGYDDNKKISALDDLRFGKYLWADIINAYYINKDPVWYDTPKGVISFNLNPITGFLANFNDYTKPLYFKQENIPWFVKLTYNYEN